MKVGVADYGMNVWDGGRFDTETRLAELKEIGYEGLERCEAATESEAVYKAARFRRLGMDFVTVRGPNIEVSIQWTAGLGKHYVWTSVTGREFDEGTEKAATDGDEIPDGLMGLDIGPKTIALYGDGIAAAKTVVWNGPMGVFEMAPFAEGTFAVARAVADSGAVSIIGGGDSVSAVKKSGLADRMSHISTGGGASLELLEGKALPGVVALTDKSLSP